MIRRRSYYSYRMGGVAVPEIFIVVKKYSLTYQSEMKSSVVSQNYIMDVYYRKWKWYRKWPSIWEEIIAKYFWERKSPNIFVLVRLELEHNNLIGSSRSVEQCVHDHDSVIIALPSFFSASHSSAIPNYVLICYTFNFALCFIAYISITTHANTEWWVNTSVCMNNNKW